MSGRQAFQEIIAGIRSDLKYLKELSAILWAMRRYDPIDIEEKNEVRDWISDVFLDKMYEASAKVACMQK